MRVEKMRDRDCLRSNSKSILKLCLREKVWKYRGEGNANLVIALPEERLILRLHKSERGKEITPQVEIEEEIRVWREVLFCRTVMVPLLGSAYIQPPKLACLDHVELTKLDASLKPLRPVYRLHKGIEFGYVTIYPDYALLPSKLKMGECCNSYCSKISSLPLQSIENHNYTIDEVTSKIMATNLSYCRNFKNICSTNCCLNDFEVDSTSNHSDTDDEEDLFIENYCNSRPNLNKSVEIPSKFYYKPENCLMSYCQLISSPPSQLNCKSNGVRRTTKGIRRFSTGSDFSYLPNSQSFIVKQPQALISSSAPVYSQLIMDLNNEKDPVFCIEIKPKQGWIPPVDRLNPKCTFCLNQFLKLSKGLVETISLYCPLDLFSGNNTRIKNALKNLLSTPQNNLKLFRDGVMIYSGDMKTDLYSVLNEWFKSSSKLTKDRPNNLNKLIDNFCHVVSNALTTDLSQGEKFPLIKNESTAEECSNSSLDSNFIPMVYDHLAPPPPLNSGGLISASGHLFDSLDAQSCDWTSQSLPANCILDRILKIQQFEQSGADTIYKKYKNICHEEGDYDYVAKLCDHPDGILNLDPVQRYLLATTAKDCSILVAFQRTNSINENVSSLDVIRRKHIMKDRDGVNYYWNIGISDLDPKPLSCIEKHRKRDAEVLSAYVGYLKNM